MRVGLLSISCAVLSVPATAQTDQVRRGPPLAWATPSALLAVPDNASGPVFVRRQDVEVHLSDQGQAQYLGYRIKILQSSALQLGNITIAWNPTAGAPIVHEIKLYRDNTVVDVLKNAGFEILRREDQLEAAKLDGTLTAVLRIPDLRVGDELEVSFTTFERDPTLSHDESGILVLAASPAAGRYHLGLSWDQNRRPNLKQTPDMTSAMVRSDKAVDFRFENPAPSSPPKDAPLRYQWRRAVEYSGFADWAAMSRLFSPLFAKAAALSATSPLKEEASRIAAAHPSDLDRAAAALKLVQQDVRYVYVGLNGGNLIPASADETWQRRYGDCKGKTALLLALLAELKIDAEPVLVNSNGADDGLDQHLPIIQFFDHVIVRARIGGTSYWLDGTLPPVAVPSTTPVLPIKWVLPLTASGTGLEKLAWRPPTVPDDVNLVEIDARSGFDKPARITSTTIIRGIKGLQQEVQFAPLTAGQLFDAFRQNALGDFWQAIDKVEWHYDQKAGASVLVIGGTGAVKWDDDGNGAKSYALPGGGFNPPERRVRGPDQTEDAPYYTKPEYTCYATTVRLPSSTKPGQWSTKPSFDTRIFGREYYRAWELRDGSIRMVRGSRVDQPEIDASTAQRDNGRIATFDNSMGYIFYDPAGQNKSFGNGEAVPTTYDFDWIANDVPCRKMSKS